MPITIANGIDLYFERRGDGAPLLFISGSHGDLRARPNQFDTPLARAFDMIAYDQRGLGQTGKPPGEYTMAQYADDAAALLDALRLDAVPVVGVSFGGMVAQEFALRHPDRVDRLILACTSSGGAGGSSYPLHELQALPPRERAEAHLRISDLRHDDEWVAANPERWERLVELTMAARRPDRDEQGSAKQLRARKGHDTYDRLPRLDVPVLLAGGRRDGIVPVANMEALHRQIAGSRFELFDGGHMFLIQDKTAYPFIVGWLQNDWSELRDEP
jgi:3-oxoadipate enol-lactonase